MYGFSFGKDSGLGILNETSALYVLDKAVLGYPVPLKDLGNGMVYYSYIFLENYKPTNESIFAISNGTIYQNSYMLNDIFGNKRISGLYIDAYTYDGSIPQEYYIFKRLTGNISNNDEYGLILRDKNGAIIFHDQLKTLKILGHVTKNNPNPVWYFGDRHVGKEIAFIATGHDFSVSSSTSPRIFRQWNTMIKKNGFIANQNPIQILKNVKTEEDARWSPNMESNQRDYDILYTIIDVTDLGMGLWEWGDHPYGARPPFVV